MPFSAEKEKDALRVSPQNNWQGVIHTGTRGFYSDSFLITDLDLVIDVTIFQNGHNPPFRCHCWQRDSACVLVTALQDSSSRSHCSYCL